MGAGMPMMHMGAVPLDQDGSISHINYNGRGNYRLLTIWSLTYAIPIDFETLDKLEHVADDSLGKPFGYLSLSDLIIVKFVHVSILST